MMTTAPAVAIVYQVAGPAELERLEVLRAFTQLAHGDSVDVQTALFLFYEQPWSLSAYGQLCGLHKKNPALAELAMDYRHGRRGPRAKHKAPA